MVAIDPIETERLILIPLSPDHLDDLIECRNSDEVFKWTSIGRWKDRSQGIDYINSKTSQVDQVNYAITLKHVLASPTHGDGAEACAPTIVGYVGTNHDEEVGYMLRSMFWGKGYATEALKGFVREYFKLFPGRKRVVARTDKENWASRRVCQKLGMVVVEEFVFDTAVLGKRDSVGYELRREAVVEWERG